MTDADDEWDYKPAKKPAAQDDEWEYRPAGPQTQAKPAAPQEDAIREGCSETTLFGQARTASIGRDSASTYGRRDGGVFGQHRNGPVFGQALAYLDT